MKIFYRVKVFNLFFLFSILGLFTQMASGLNINIGHTPVTPPVVGAPVISYTGPQTHIVGTPIVSLTAVNSGGAVPAGIHGQVSAFAGYGSPGDVNNTGTTFNNPFGVADAQGSIAVTAIASPAITSISPATGPVGTLVTVIGTNLANPTAFTIGGVAAIVVSNTGTQLVGMVMPGAVTGAVSLATAGGTAAGSNFTVTPTLFPKAQQGAKLVGTGGSTASAQLQGTSVAISADGNTAIVGGTGDDQGASWIYIRSGGVWTQQGAKLMGGTGATDSQGSSVAISADGNTVIEGDPAYNNNQGTAWIFVRSGVTWAEQGMAAGTNASSTSVQGTSVSLSADGNTAVVGGNGDSPHGAVWVYTRSNGVWTQQGAKLVGTGGGTASQQQQGTSVAISADGNTIVEGDPTDNNVGAVWIFNRSAGTWAQQGAKLVGTGIGGTFTAPGISIAGSPNQGTSVAVSADGNTIIVGGPDDNSTIAPEAGAVWVYTRSGGTWTQQGAKLSGTGAVGSAMQGWSVSLSADGNTAIIGGSGGDNNGLGAVWLFTRNGGAWTQKGTKLVGTGSSNDAGQGSSVAISADGNTALMGGPGDNGGVGAAWVFTEAAQSPVIASFAPVSAGPGVSVIITGTNFTGATAVSFGGTAAASFTVISDTQITAVVGAGASGKVSITTPAGTVTLAGFTLTTAPVISYASPQTYTTGVPIASLAPTNTGGAVPVAIYGQVSTFAGSGTVGAANGTGTAASFNVPSGIAVDAAGNIYVADFSNNLIRKITSAGVVTTIAGSGTAGSANGTGTAASFNQPSGVAIDASGNLYVADGNNNLIRKITPAGVVSTFAGSGAPGSANGTGTAASFWFPTDVAVDASGNVYVSDAFNNAIRKISPAGVVSTLSTGYTSPFGLAVDAKGNVYVSDFSNRIFKVTPAGVSTLLAGSGSAGAANGAGATASFNNPNCLTVDAAGDVYVGDSGNNLIREITPAGIVTTVAGSGAGGSANGIGTTASFNAPYGVAFDASGNLYVSDQLDNLIRKVITTGYSISPVLPTGLTFNGATGIISGTPTVSSPATNYTITAYNSGGRGTATLSIAVTQPLAPAISYAGPQTYIRGTAIAPLAPTNTGGAVPANIYGQASTFAGSGTAVSTNGTGTAASFNHPIGAAVDVSGNVYVADGNLIRKITTAGVVTTLAGSGATGSANGTGTAASFSAPYGLAVDGAGNVYVADTHDQLIRKITPAGVVTTFAGSGATGSANGTGTAASFNVPSGVAVDAAGNVYVVDTQNQLIRKITPAGVVTTLAGSGSPGSANGTGTAASFNNPNNLATDASGNVYVADFGNNLIRKITQAGVVTTFAGSGAGGAANGAGTAASFNGPFDVTIDATGNLYVSDALNNLIRKINPAGLVTTLAGNGTSGSANGIGTAASFSFPWGVAADRSGNVYVADDSNNLIRKITVTGYSISPALPVGLAFDGTTGIISGTPTASSPAANYTITAYNLGGSSTATLNITVNVPGTVQAPAISYAGPQTYTSGTAIASLTPTNTGGAVPANIYGQVSTFAGNGVTGNANGTGTAASFNNPYGTATDAAGNVYIADAINNLIRKITPAGIVTTFAGNGTAGSANGTGTAASFNSPYGVAVDGTGNVFVTDQNNNLIRKITPAGVVTTLAGNGTRGKVNGTGTAASFNTPYGIAADGGGNLYVGDFNNNLIRKITQAGVVTTLAGSGIPGSADGTGSAASFNGPSGIAVDASGNVYVADTYNTLIRKISPAGVVTTLAGNTVGGAANGTGMAASFSPIEGVAVDASGNVYVADTYNNLIRKITPTGVVTTLAGNGTLGAVNGIGTAASFYSPNSITVDAIGNLYVSEPDNIIRKITITGYTISPALPTGLAFDGTKGIISGTSTVSSPATNYTIIAYNATGISTATLSIAVNTNTPTIQANHVTFTNTTTTGTTASWTNGNGTARAVFITRGASGSALPLDDSTYTANTMYGWGSEIGATGWYCVYNGTGSAVSITGLTSGVTYRVMTVEYDGAAGGQNYLTTTATNNPANVTQSPSADALLGALTLSSGTLSPVFSAGVTNYSASVANTVSTITIMPTVNDTTARIKLNGTAIANGNASAAIPLSVGNNSILVLVTAQDGVTTQTYTVNVTRAASSNAGLTNITISNSALNPDFAVNTTSYTAGVVDSISSVTITPTLSDANATVTVNGAAVASGSASAAIALNIGNSNLVTIAVTAQDGITVKTYTINVTREIPDLFSLPSNNFKLTITSATCKGSSNGSVNITAGVALGYIANFSGNGLNTSYPFTDSLNINNLAAGAYSVCITVVGQSSYQQCYDAIITEPQDLSVYSTINQSNHTLNLALSGANQYNINLNGTLYTTTDNAITLPLSEGNNNLSVTTDRLCQGTFQKLINVPAVIIPYPVPFQNTLNLDVGINNINNISVEIHNVLDGSTVYAKQYVNQSGVLQLDLTSLKGGVYALHLSLDNSEKTFKIFKK